MTTRLLTQPAPDIPDWQTIDKPTQNLSLDISKDENTASPHAFPNTSDWEKVDKPADIPLPYQDLTQIHASSTLVAVANLNPAAAFGEWTYYYNLNPRLDPRSLERKRAIKIKVVLGFFLPCVLILVILLVNILLQDALSGASHKPDTDQVRGRWTCHWEPDPAPAATVTIKTT